MRTVQMTLEDELVKEVDRAARRLNSTRSAFTRRALREALARQAAMQLEQRHRSGYEKHPVRQQEFSVWEAEQAWGEE